MTLNPEGRPAPISPAALPPVDRREPDKGSGVKEAWFKGYSEGFIRWPSMDRGLTVFTTAAILSDPPDNWGALTRSVLSPVQVSELTQLRKKLHGHHDINDAALNISDGRVQDQWNAAVNNMVVPTLRSYPPIERYIQSSSPSATREEIPALLQGYFADPQNKAEIDDLTQMFAVAQATLETPDSKKLSDFYKAAITGDYTYYADRPKIASRYLETFGEPMSAYTEENQGLGAWDLAGHSIRTALADQFPEQNFSWLENRLAIPRAANSR